MPDPDERTVMRHLKTTVSSAAVAAVVVLSAASCSNSTDPKGTATESTASPTTSEVTYDDEHAFTEAEKAAKKAVARDRNEPVPEDATWATDTYRQDRAAALADNEKQGITLKGTTEWTGFKRGMSNPDAAGGWDLTAYVCSRSDTRAYKGSKDVSLGADGKPLPKGKRDVVALYSFTTPDKGKTWQVNDTQQVEDESCDE
ncbi:hypothetical protein [Janibacter terrae]|uniref:hypothetical protein n=1 Tax=Janibacter terrae TaxID=103817 RepID=UPI0008342995|nr:hypothetical protein [Janibacter terrae]